jgi:hypothetical protein
MVFTQVTIYTQDVFFGDFAIYRQNRNWSVTLTFCFIFRFLNRRYAGPFAFIYINRGVIMLVSG